MYDFAAERAFEQILKVAEIAVKIAQAVGSEIDTQAIEHYRVLTEGTATELRELGDKHQQVAAVLFGLAVKVSELAADMTPETKGRIYGAVVWEVAQEVAEILLTGGAASVATKGAKFAHIADKLADLGKVGGKLDNFADTLKPIIIEIAKLCDEGGELRNILAKLDGGVETATNELNRIRRAIDSTDLGRFFSKAFGLGRKLSRAEVEQRLAKEVENGLEIVWNAKGHAGAFTMTRKNGRLVPAIEIPEGGITDLGLEEELLHLAQARREGFEAFARIQKAGTDVINLLESGEFEKLQNLLRALPQHHRKDVLADVKKYVELELEAKKAIRETPRLRKGYTDEAWSTIDRELNEWEKYHRRQLQRLSHLEQI